MDPDQTATIGPRSDCSHRIWVHSLSKKLLQHFSKRQKQVTSVVVAVFVFNVPTTVKVIWRPGHGLKSHPTD